MTKELRARSKRGQIHQVALRLGHDAEESIFALQEAYSKLIGVAPSRSILVRRALYVLRDFVADLEQQGDAAAKQDEEIFVHRLSRSA